MPDTTPIDVQRELGNDSLGALPSTWDFRAGSEIPRLNRGMGLLGMPRGSGHGLIGHSSESVRGGGATDPVLPPQVRRNRPAVILPTDYDDLYLIALTLAMAGAMAPGYEEHCINAIDKLRTIQNERNNERDET